MALIRNIVLFIIVAVGVGLGSAYFSIKHADQLDLYSFGPWHAWPTASGPNANPYAQAQQAQSGALPLGASEGLAFEAKTDNAGTPLDGDCQYRLRGTHLPARLWTLTLTRADGSLVKNPSKRYGFHSQSIAWQASNSYEIFTGPQVMGGHWLKSPEGQPFRLVLRLYETSLNTSVGYGQITLPDIEWVSCQ